ncbi:hypothetical protein QQ045_027445 [Rhodiola kirilowii]
MRNKVKHGDNCSTPAEAVARILSLAAEFRKASKDATNSHLCFSDFEWKPPARGTVKINCDASWDDALKIGSVGAIARDHAGSILGVRAAHSVQCLNSFDCEGTGVLEGLRLGKALQANRIILESDCAELVSCLNHHRSTIGSKFDWFKKCIQELDDNPVWSVFLIKREDKIVAYQLAKRARLYRWSWNRLDACPLMSF